jgi:hypothetical protein
MARSFSANVALVAAPVVACALGAAVFLWTKTGGDPPQEPPELPTPDTPKSARAPGFQEGAREAGIDFRMRFLPGEQGENFKVNLYDHGCGVAVGDFDGDGRDDVFFCNQLGPCALYRNKGDGTFEDVTARAGVVLGDRVCVGATFADYDNDGHQDLFLTSTRGGNILFHNNGDGTFTDVTKKAGVAHVGHSQTAVFFDYDNDGRLDLLVTNTAQWTTNDIDAGDRHFRGPDSLRAMLTRPKEDNILYHNNGDGTFTDVTKKSGLQGKGWSSDVAVLDFDEDGYLDVLITNMFGKSQLYRNKGDGTFTDVTRDTLGLTPFGSVGAKVLDMANDGRLSIFITDMHSDMWMGVDETHRSLPLAREWANKKAKYAGGPQAEQGASDPESRLWFGVDPKDVFYGNGLYQNLGGGKFAEVSDKAGMETFWPWGIAAGDFDNNGREDVFIAAGMGYPFYYWPNSLMMNNGNGTFTDRARDLGIEPPPRGRCLPETIRGRVCVRSSRCCASADFDGDGRVDLVVNNFNDYPYYFRNEFPRKNWIAFRLTGTRSNRDAVGAVVRLYAGKEVMTRQVNPAGGYLSQSSKTLHFGLGDRAKVDRIEIRWPRGRGQPQTIDNPEINQLHPVVEPRE